MKKILAIALALVLVCSMGMVALAEDPALGTKENPYQVSNPMQFSNFVEVPANSTVYYAYNMQFFGGMSIVVQGVDAVTMNDADVPYSPVDWGFKAELTSVNPMYPKRLFRLTCRWYSRPVRKTISTSLKKAPMTLP